MKLKSTCIVSFLAISLCLFGNLSAQCPEGDLDGNGVVGIEDLLLFADQWLDPAGCAGQTQDCADLISGDGVNSGDFGVFAEGWKKEMP